MSNHRRSSVFILVLVVSFLALSLVAVPTLGQEVTPEVTPDLQNTPAATLPPDPTTPPPTEEPTQTPVETETPAPTTEPTDPPVVDETPTQELTVEPTVEVTQEPTLDPTVEVTDEPTQEPAVEPTVVVTDEPTPAATEELTLAMPFDALGDPTCEMEVVQASPTDRFTFNFVGTSTDALATFTWSVDGTPVSTSPNTTYTFAGPGEYVVTLDCVTIDGPLTISGSVNLWAIPQALFSVAPMSIGFVPLAITATNQSTGDNLTFTWQVEWRLRDTDPWTVNTTACAESGVNLGCNFTVAGQYRIQLTATNTFGSSVHWQQVTVAEYPPHVNFTVSPVSGLVVTGTPFVVTVTPVVYSDSGPVDSWVWSLDGVPFTPSQTTPTDPFTITLSDEPDTYTIRLDYSGPGGSGTVTKVVTLVDDGELIFAGFTLVSQRDVNGGIEVCFLNDSTGPIVHNWWTFGDGTPAVEANDSIVCHIYTGAGPWNNILVLLHAQNADNTVSNEATGGPYTFYRAPVAVITSPAANSSYTWGDQIDLDGSNSTGAIETYAWTINGVAVGSEAELQDILLNTIGPNIIRLTVTGPGGTSFAETTITVNRLELTCDFTGSLAFYPSTQSFTQNVGNVGGRPVTIHWSVTGPLPAGPTVNYFNTSSISHAFTATGNYTVTMTASTPDGSSCSKSSPVSVQWPALVCGVAGDLAPLPDGATQTYTSTTTGNLAGRTLSYEWFVNGVPVQSGPLGTLDRSYTLHNTVEVIRVVVTPSAGAGCESTVTVRAAWPELTCAISGDFLPNPLPAPSQTYTYTADTGSSATGRTLSYVWSVSGSGMGASGGTAGTITRTFDYTQEGQTATFNLTVTATSPTNEVETKSCTATTARVTTPNVTCPDPSGDRTPVLEETVIYGAAAQNLFGRTPVYTWSFEHWDTATSAWENVPFTPSGPNGSLLAHQFTLPNETYRIRYRTDVSNPTQNCTSNWVTITTPTPSDAKFTCESTVISGNAAPLTQDYLYSITVDNTGIDPSTNADNLLLNYRWVLLEPGAPAGGRVVAEYTSSDDGTISRIFNSLTQFGPVGLKTLRVTVSAVDQSQTAYTCFNDLPLNVGTVTVNFSATPATHTMPNVQVGEQVCLDNLSTTSHTVPAGSTDGLTYTWDFGTTNTSLGQISTSVEPGCITFSQQGNYTIKLVGTNPAGDKTAEYSVPISVWNAQSILVEQTNNSSLAGQQFCFDGPGVNINSRAWTITSLPGGATVATGSGNTICRVLAAGQYRVTVVGTGPLGNNTASLDVTVNPPTYIAAAFTPSQYAGVAPMRVCFTDNSRGTITGWEWDFGNGQTLNYTTPPAEICTDYTDPGRVYPVTLRVYNASALSASATNRIRTYTVSEASSTFSIRQNSQTEFCFTAILGPGAELDGWDFGDGTTGGAVSPTCHPYAAAGTYLVKMKLKDGGEVWRPVIVQPPPVNPPSLTPTAQCSAARTATFRITNTGGAMTVTDMVRVTNVDGQVIYIGSLRLGANTYTEFSLDNQHGPVTLTTADTTLTVTANCNYRPAVTVSGVCQSGTAAFMVNNPAGPRVGPMHAPQSYEIRNSAGTVVAGGTGTFQLADGTSQTIPVPAGLDPYDTYTFVSNGYAGNFSVAQNCNTRPVLTITQVCGTPVQFTITNTGGPLVVPEHYRIATGSTTVLTGVWPAGQTFPVTLDLPAGSNPYAQYRLTSDNRGFTNIGTQSPTRCAQPTIVVTFTCASPLTVAVRNTGGAMLIDQPYTVKDPGGATVASGTLSLAAGASLPTFSLTGLDPHIIYTFNSPGFASVTQTSNCPRPVLQVTSACTSPVAFTVRNTGGAMLESQTYTIKQGATTILTGPITLGAGASTLLTPPAATTANPYIPYTFETTGLTGPVTYTRNCGLPVIAVAPVCGNPGSFTVTNTGGPIQLPLTYTITSGGSPVSSGMLPNLLTNGTTSISLPAGSNPYNPYVFTTADAAGYVAVATATLDCPDPVLTVTSTCGYPLTFIVQNSGGNMLVPQTYTVTDLTTNLTVGGLPATFTVNGGATTSITLTGIDPYQGYRFNTSGFAGTLVQTQNCARPVLNVTRTCASPFDFTISNTGGAVYAPVTYRVRVSGQTTNIVNGTITSATSLPLTRTMANTNNPYLTYVFSTPTGFATLVTTALQNCAPPVVTVTRTCASPFDFVVNNTGGALVVPMTYAISNGTTTPVSGSFAVGTTFPQTLTLPAGSDPYLTYTFTSSSGFVTPVTTALQNCTRPTLTVTRTCASPLDFTVDRTGGPLLLPVTYAINNGTADVVSGTFAAGAGFPQTLTLPAGSDPHLTYTFTTTGSHFATIVTTPLQNCARPTLTATRTCASNPLQFTVTRSGGGLLLPVTYSLTEGANTIASGTFTSATTFPQTFTLTAGSDPYLTYTFTMNGDFTILLVTNIENCARPTLTVERTCASNPLQFRVTRSGGALVVPVSYTINNGTSNVVSSSFAAGTTFPQILNLPAGSDPYLTYTFSATSGHATIVTTGIESCTRPTLTVTRTCASNPLNFEVARTGGPLVVPVTYAINNGTANVVSGSFAAGASFSQTLTLPAGSDPYLTYTFSASTGFATLVTTPLENCTRPTLTVTRTCAANPFDFEVARTGGPLVVPVTYAINNGTSNVVSGTFAAGTSFPTTLTLPAGSDPYLTYTFSASTGFATIVTTPLENCTRPTLTVTRTCASNPMNFTVARTGGALVVPVSYTINNGTADVVSGSFAAGASFSQTLTLPAGIDPYLTYTFSASTGFTTIVTTPLENCTRPTLTVTRTCAADPLDFEVVRTGGALVVPVSYTINNGTANVVSGSFAAGASFSQTLTLPAGSDPYLTYTFSASTGFTTIVTTPLENCTRPTLTVTRTCAANPFDFEVARTGGLLVVPVSYTINNGTANVVSGSFAAGASFSQTLTLPAGSDPYLTYTFSASTGFATIVTTPLENCTRPTLTVTRTCAANPFDFEVARTGGALVVPVTYAISNGSSNVVSGTFAAGASFPTTLTLPAGSDPYLTYTFSASTGFATIVTTPLQNCARPTLTVTRTCAADPLDFEVVRTGGELVVPVTYAINNGTTNVVSGTFAAGSTFPKTLSLPAGSDPYLTYTFSASTGFATLVTTAIESCARPTLTVTRTCAANPMNFTVARTGGPVVVPVTYAINNGTADVVSGSFAAGASFPTTLTLPAGSNPYLTYTFSASTGHATIVTTGIETCAQPVLSISSVCAYPIQFTVENTGGPMLVAQSFTITTSTGTVRSGNLNLATGASRTITLGGLDPYAGYTFNTAGFAGTHAVPQNCPKPKLVIESECAFPVEFTVTNTGGDMLLNQQFTIVNGANVDVTPANNNLNLATNASRTIRLTGLDPYAGYTLTTNGFAGNYSGSANCAQPVLVISHQCAFPVEFTVTNTGGPMLLSQQFTIVNGANVDMTPANNNLNLATNASRTIRLTGLDPYAGYTFSTTGFAGTASQAANCPKPNLVIQAECANPIVFTVTNTGGDMLLRQDFTIVNGANLDVTPANNRLNLARNESRRIRLDGLDPYAGYTLSTGGFAGTYTMTRNCARPAITITSVCGNPIVFTVTNSATAGDMLLAEGYTITGGASPVTGTFDLAPGASTTVTLPADINPYSPYTFTTDNSGFTNTASFTHDCPEPALVITSTCASPIVFTIENTGGAMLMDQTYTVTSGGSPVRSGALKLAAGGSTTVTLTGLDPYAGYTLSTGGFAGTYTMTQNCARPAITITSVCGNPIVFTVTNSTTAGDMLLAEGYTITGGASPITGTFDLAPGASTTVTLPADINPYSPYTFTTDNSGFTNTASFTHDCADPVLVITSTCSFPIAFEVVNTGGPMLIGQDFTIVNGAGLDVTPAAHTLNLAANGATTITLTGLDPYAGYTLSTGGFAGTYTMTQNCARPNLAVELVCGVVPRLTVRNNGGQMLLPQEFSVSQQGGRDITPVPNTLELAAGASIDLQLTKADAYLSYTFQTSGFAGTLNASKNCALPSLAAEGTCDPVAFNIVNFGADMLVGQSYTITDSNGVDVTPANGGLTLAAGARTTISVPNADPALNYTFTTAGVAGTTTATTNCAKSVGLIPTLPPGTGGTGGTTGGSGVVDGVNNTGIQPPPVCGRNCPTFRLYHTNETGNWEIFRLDSADPVNRTSDRTNLSLGEGEGVNDMAPSLSPNTEWIVFTSNRASVPNQPENWELFVAPTSGGDPDAVRRVTWNTTANDTDPVWGPNNWVAFESNRNGDWDLYAIDMSTGLEYRLTDDPADDINPFWSPDGSKLLFQSDRDGQWQIYELTLGSGTLRRLSDGTAIDVDPTYSPDGTRIAFRSYSDAGANSVIHLMNANGQNRMAITTASQNATNQVWSPNGQLIAFQSDLDGDLDIYVYELSSGATRLVTDNEIADYAPTWRCGDDIVIFTSDIDGDPNIFEENARPITDPAVLVNPDSDQLTFEVFDDVYPQMNPSEEDASLEGQTSDGVFGEQTVFLEPVIERDTPDLSIDGLTRDAWLEIDGCEPAA